MKPVRNRVRAAAQVLSGIRFAGLPGTIALIGLTLLQTIAPILMVVVFSALAASASRPDTAAMFTATCALGALAAAQRLVETVAEPIGFWVARRVDIEFRSELADAIGAPASIAFRESPEFQSHLASVRADFQGHSPGTATVGVFALAGKMAVAVWCFLVIAPHSLAAAVAAVIVVVIRRQLQQNAFDRLYTWWGDVGLATKTYDFWRMFHLDASAAKEVRIFGLADWAVDRFRAAALARFSPVWAGRRSASRRSWFAAAAAAVGAFLLLAVLAISPGLDVAAIATVIGAGLTVLRVTEPAGENLAIEHARPVYAAAAAIRSAVERELAAQPKPTARLSADGPPSVALTGLHFGYPGRQPVLRGLDLRLRGGTTVGLVGENGSGKTTLTKLMSGLYRPSAGAVMIDGRDLADCDPEAWFRRLAVLPQSFVRYDLPLRDNITLGAPERHGDGDFFTLIRGRLGIDDLVARLPHGWDTHLGRAIDTGVDLSGGEWQRVGLARVVFAVEAGRDVVILDEPTAHLDAEAEALIQEQLERIASRVTLLLVSHRLGIIRRADHIALLSEGRIAEQGDHDSLVALNGRYAAMYRAQAERFAESAGVS